MNATRRLVCFPRTLAAALCALCLTGCAGKAPPHAGDPPEINAPFEKGDTAAAMDLLETRLRRPSPQSTDCIRLSRLHRARGTVPDRLSAQRVLEDCLREHPDDTDLLVEIGKTYYEQGFYGDARKMFSRALERDPRRCEAHACLGADAFRKWQNVQSYTEYLTGTVEHLRYAVDCAPGDRESHFKLAFSHYILGDTSLALEACESLRRNHPRTPDALFLEGAVAFERGQWALCADLFRDALAALPDDDRDHYADIALFLDAKDDLEQYEEASAEERLRLQRLYWIEHDPDPTTEVNPRFLEHVYRVFLSEVRFARSKPKLRAWETERGQTFIKFGAPTHVRSTLEGARPWDGRTEVWTYLDDRRAFDLYFRDEYLNGNYTVPVDDALSAQTLFGEPVFSRSGGDAAPVDAYVEAAAFRESEVSGAVYVSFSMEEDSLQRHIRTWRVDSLTCRAAFYGEDGGLRARFSRSVPIDSVPVRELPGGRLRLFAARYELPFDSYRAVHCIEDDRALTRSIAWSHVNTLRFTGGSLSMSDVLLHTLPGAPAGPCVERRGKRFVPAHRGRFARTEKLGVYLEIYNLDVVRGTSSFGVTYSIFPVERQAGFWKRLGRSLAGALPGGGGAVIRQSFERRSEAPWAAEELAVDIDSLEPGEYTVSVSVLDHHSGKRAAVSKAFSKLVRGATR